MEIEGVLDRIIFRNEDNGYTVANFLAEDGDIVVVGSHIALHEQEHLRLEGELIWHPKYGEQFQFERVTKIRPRGKKAVISYLSGGLIPHVGKVTAKRIVETFGDATLDIIEKEPERLKEVEGIGKKKLEVILEALERQKGMREFLLDAASYDLTSREALAIYKVFGDDSQSILESDPFQLVGKVRGIGFLKADAMAQKMGMDREGETRVLAGMKYILKEGIRNGYTYLPLEAVVESAAELLDLKRDHIGDYIPKLAVDPEIYIVDREGVKVYFIHYYRAETFVARSLEARGRAPLSEDMAKDIASAVADSLDVALGNKQREALDRAVDSRLLVITGGPGTGKTTTLKAIVQAMEKMNLSIALAAPTGRAAKRMEEATGREASTIHRLLQYDYIDEEGDESQISGDKIEADAVIVDEASMIDLLLMRDLLSSLKDETRLILVGDGDQLPPVGAGNVLGDILKSGKVETVRLDEIFRQAESSYIVKNAHRINHGEPPIVNTKGSDFFFIEEPNPERVAATITSLVKERLPKFFKVDPIDAIQVLAPMKKGVCGVENLNLILQEAPNERKKGLNAYGFTYKVGDKVMQTKNNYDMEWKSQSKVFNNEGSGIFNGDLGRVTVVDPDARFLKVLYDDKLCMYTEETLSELQPAYATTIHKSQGSEFPVVIIPVLSGPPMLQTRNLLYTGITRAKKAVVLVGSHLACGRMIQNNRIDGRYSDLDRLLEEGQVW